MQLTIRYFTYPSGRPLLADCQRSNPSKASQVSQFMFCSDGLADAIAADPVDDRIFFGANQKIEQINADGSRRKTVISHPEHSTPSMAVDLKKR